MMQKEPILFACAAGAKSLLSILVSLALLLASACGKKADEELVIISPHSPEIRKEFSNAFQAWYEAGTGKSIEVKWLDLGGTSKAIKYVESRARESRQIGVDLFFGGGVFPFTQLQKKKLLQPYVISRRILTKIPSEIHGVRVYDENSMWYGAALSGFGIIYNKSVLKANNLPEPVTWEDLNRAECAGWVASGDPRYSGSIHAMYEVLLQAYGWQAGWEVIALLGANVQSFSEGGSSAAKDVAMGQAAYGLCIDFYAYTEIERYGSERLGFVLPEGLTVITPDPIGIIKHAPNRKAAEAFVDFVLSEGQKLWLFKKGIKGGPQEKALCRTPVDETIYNEPKTSLSVQHNPYAIKSTLNYSDRTAGRRWAILGDLVAANIITPHDELKACVAAILTKSPGTSLRDNSSLFALDLSEEQAFAYSKDWSKPEFAEERLDLMNTWTQQARARYKTGSKESQAP